jgi:hypothetical protein
LILGSKSSATAYLDDHSPEAGAQRTLYAVACKRLILIEASPSVDHGGRLARGTGSLAHEMVCWTSHTAVDRHGLIPVSCLGARAAFGWASRAMAAASLEKPHKSAMEEKRWDQPETREHIRYPK